MRAVKGGQREHLAEATFKYKAGSVLPLEASILSGFRPRRPCAAASAWATAASVALAGAARLKCAEASAPFARGCTVRSPGNAILHYGHAAEPNSECLGSVLRRPLPPASHMASMRLVEPGSLRLLDMGWRLRDGSAWSVLVWNAESPERVLLRGRIPRVHCRCNLLLASVACLQCPGALEDFDKEGAQSVR